MDKAQARILTLVLIAVLFLGQALYDFIKKNRSRSATRPRHTISKPRPQKTTQQRHHRQPIAATPASKRRTVSELAGLSALESVSASAESQPLTIDATDEMSEKDVSTGMSQGMDAPDGEELRRAVIWSEILKRKF